jgi:hypothetical protein
METNEDSTMIAKIFPLSLFLSGARGEEYIALIIDAVRQIEDDNEMHKDLNIISGVDENSLKIFINKCDVEKDLSILCGYIKILQYILTKERFLMATARGTNLTKIIYKNLRSTNIDLKCALINLICFLSQFRENKNLNIQIMEPRFLELITNQFKLRVIPTEIKTHIIEILFDVLEYEINEVSLVIIVKRIADIWYEYEHILEYDTPIEIPSSTENDEDSNTNNNNEDGALPENINAYLGKDILDVGGNCLIPATDIEFIGNTLVLAKKVTLTHSEMFCMSETGSLLNSFLTCTVGNFQRVALEIMINIGQTQGSRIDRYFQNIHFMKGMYHIIDNMLKLNVSSEISQLLRTFSQRDNLKMYFIEEKRVLEILVHFTKIIISDERFSLPVGILDFLCSFCFLTGEQIRKLFLNTIYVEFMRALITTQNETVPRETAVMLGISCIDKLIEQVKFIPHASLEKLIVYIKEARDNPKLKIESRSSLFMQAKAIEKAVPNIRSTQIKIPYMYM